MMSPKGAKPTICDCPYTDWCEDTRQWLRDQFRKNGSEKSVQDCDYYKMIEEKEKSTHKVICERCERLIGYTEEVSRSVCSECYGK